MRGKRPMVLGWGLLVLALVASACSKTYSSSAGAYGNYPAASSASDAGGGYGSRAGGGYGSGSSSGSAGSSSDVADVSGKSTFAVVQDNFSFSPSTLQGTAGEQITLTIENDGSSPHTFTIDSENISVTLQPGDQQQVKVTFPKFGSVPFYCEFHKSMGMAGELTVK